jgi:hypothetical protein
MLPSLANLCATGADDDAPRRPPIDMAELLDRVREGNARREQRNERMSEGTRGPSEEELARMRQLEELDATVQRVNTSPDPEMSEFDESDSGFDFEKALDMIDSTELDGEARLDSLVQLETVRHHLKESIETFVIDDLADDVRDGAAKLRSRLTDQLKTLDDLIAKLKDENVDVVFAEGEDDPIVVEKLEDDTYKVVVYDDGKAASVGRLMTSDLGPRRMAYVATVLLPMLLLVLASLAQRFAARQDARAPMELPLYDPNRMASFSRSRARVLRLVTAARSVEF